MTDSTPRGDALDEAKHLITGDRNVSYGTPTANFANIAEIWTTLFRHKMLPGVSFDAREVADAMIALKIARSIAQPKRDNYVDVAGYAGCAVECLEPAPEPLCVEHTTAGVINVRTGETVERERAFAPINSDHPLA